MVADHRQRAFTLAELLACIAIVAIVCAVVAPVVGCGGGGGGGGGSSQTPAQQQQAQCLSNMEQINRGLQAYTADYDERLPGGLNGYGGGSGWAGQIYPYVKSTAMFVCPADPGNTTTGDSTIGAGPWRASSYAINSNASLANPYSQSCSSYGEGVLLTQFTAPSKTVMLFEVTNASGYNVDTETQPMPIGTVGECGGSASGNGLGGSYLPSAFNSSPNPGNTVGNTGFAQYDAGEYAGVTSAGSFYSVTGRHQNGANYILADGHAAWFVPAAISAGTNAATPTGKQILESAGGPTAQYYSPSAGTAGTEADGKTVPSATFSII